MIAAQLHGVDEGRVADGADEVRVARLEKLEGTEVNVFGTMSLRVVRGGYGGSGRRGDGRLEGRHGASKGSEGGHGSTAVADEVGPSGPLRLVFVIHSAEPGMHEPWNLQNDHV